MNTYYPPADFWWTAWAFDPGIWFSIVLLHGAYLLAVGPFRTRFPRSQPITTFQLVCWTAGILTLVLALVTPVSTLADQYLFSAHMFQHVLLTLIAPPLMLLGLPGWLFNPLENIPWLLALARKLTRPFLAFVIFNVTFAAWHIPSFYNLALYSTPVHLLEHFTMVFSAFLLWMPVLSPTPLLPRAPLPVQVLYIFLASVLSTGLGALITLAKQPIYVFYAQASRIWGVSVLDDQVIAGLIMWAGAAAIFLIALSIVFFYWFSAKGPIAGEHEFI